MTTRSAGPSIDATTSRFCWGSAASIQSRTSVTRASSTGGRSPVIDPLGAKRSARMLVKWSKQNAVGTSLAG
ncbi:MAG: hypothetical protein ACRDYB_14845 [Acidimicrobiales bacterium]